MCDQYWLDNPCGDMKAYWNEYWNTYHPIHSWMNWADNTMNNAGGWTSCFDWMNAHSINNVWLFADNTGDESVIQNWCINAWEKSWLLRQEKYLTIVYQCSGLDCSQPNGGNCMVTQFYLFLFIVLGMDAACLLTHRHYSYSLI